MREVTLQIAPDEVRAPKRPESAPDIRKSPGPSRVSYRLKRAWAKPVVRGAVLVYLPLTLLGLAGWHIAADDGMRRMVEQKVAALVERFAARPEFAVKGVQVIGGTDAVKAEVLGILGVVPGTSSLTFDVTELRRRVETLGAVERAAVQFDTQGMLRVTIVQRIEVALHRRGDGALVLLDKGGVEIGPAGPRAGHPDLPVILGAGAPERVAEVLDLLDSAPDIVPRLRALVRIGERRWDMVLDRDMIVMLPTENPVDALSRVMALHYGEELLDRDLAVIDMRLPARPVLRMTPEAAETYQIRKAVAAVGGEET
jgi:cell division protein FtsQ